MKSITIFLLLILISQLCLSQKPDTIRIYDYLKPYDSWRIKVENEKFILYADILGKENITVNGFCNVTASAIRFHCDTSRLRFKYLAKDRLKAFTNIPFILTGEPFKRLNNLFIPHNINFDLEDSLITPKGIFAKYFRGDGFGNNTIELYADNTYTLSGRDCVSRSEETGTWSLQNGLITFYPCLNGWSMLEWITEGRRLFLVDEYLIGKKEKKAIAKSGRVVITETYLYLAKEPVYPVN